MQFDLIGEAAKLQGASTCLDLTWSCCQGAKKKQVEYGRYPKYKRSWASGKTPRFFQFFPQSKSLQLRPRAASNRVRASCCTHCLKQHEQKMCEHRVIKGLGCAADGGIFCHRFEEKKKSWLMMVDSFFCYSLLICPLYIGDCPNPWTQTFHILYSISTDHSVALLRWVCSFSRFPVVNRHWKATGNLINRAAKNVEIIAYPQLKGYKYMDKHLRNVHLINVNQGLWPLACEKHTYGRCRSLFFRGIFDGVQY